MKNLLRLILLTLVLMTMAGCGGHDPIWRMKAQLTLLQLQDENASNSYPDDYTSISKTFLFGELLLTEEDEAELADEQYKLAYQKGLLLKQELRQYKERLKEEARLKLIEEQAVREEEERARLEAERKREQELAEAQNAVQRKKDGDTAAGEGSNQVTQLTSYTVKRGETLPQIAARPELYNDAALWPLIYRANRDQIRDPYQLWPGQVLKVPRNFSRDEALEARRQAHRRGQ